MSFTKLTKQKYPPRLWVLVGFPDDGKSTFLAQMKGPILPIDADHRIDQVLDSNPGQEFLKLCDSPVDHINPHAIAKHLAEKMPGSNVGTIGIDSLTAIIIPRVVRAMVAKEEGEEKNLSVAFRDKALALREIQDAVTGYGVDVLWIWHLDKSRNAKGDKEIIRETLSELESNRLKRSINMRLEIVREEDKRGVKVVWSRERYGMTLWDETKNWYGMPERIEAAVYDPLQPTREQLVTRYSQLVGKAATLSITAEPVESFDDAGLIKAGHELKAAIAAKKAQAQTPA